MVIMQITHKVFQQQEQWVPHILVYAYSFSSKSNVWKQLTWFKHTSFWKSAGSCPRYYLKNSTCIQWIKDKTPNVIQGCLLINLKSLNWTAAPVLLFMIPIVFNFNLICDWSNLKVKFHLKSEKKEKVWSGTRI